MNDRLPTLDLRTAMQQPAVIAAPPTTDGRRSVAFAAMGPLVGP